MRKNISLLSLFTAIFLIGGTILWHTVVVGWIDPPSDGFDTDSKSSDLARDIRLMWQTEPLRGTSNRENRSSTKAAINASSRVFNSVELVGKSRDEVIKLLGDPKSSSDSHYNFPFYSAPNGALVYRFDTGAYGWQFNVEFNDDGNVRGVERLGIE